MKRYAFITGGRNNFPDPFLVEISRRTRTRPQQVAFFEPDVVYCPSFANQVLKSVLEQDRAIFVHRAIVKPALLEYFLKFEGRGTEAEVKEGVAWSLIVVEAAKMVDASNHPGMRSTAQVQAATINVWRVLHKKRLVEEEHLGKHSLGEEVSRSMAELHFAFCRVKACHR